MNGRVPENHRVYGYAYPKTQLRNGLNTLKNCNHIANKDDFNLRSQTKSFVLSTHYTIYHGNSKNRSPIFWAPDLQSLSRVLNEFIYRAIEGHASLLFAHKTDIRKIDLDRHNSMVSIVNDTRSSCAIDYNFRTGMIYWSDVMTQKIYK